MLAVTITRQLIVAEAIDWCGTPWHHGQMAKGLGCDCLGFFAGVGYAIGYADARAAVRNRKFRVYGRSPDPTMLDAACEEYLDPLEIKDARLADILRMTSTTGRHAQHFAMVSRVDALDRPTHIVHCTNAFPFQVVEHSYNDEWRDRVRRAYAWRGVA